jgi:tryptophan synthase alpha chain
MRTQTELFLPNKKIFVGYLTAGQREKAYMIRAAQALHEGGIDVLEVGVPFSDPIADGPVIQEAMHQALLKQYSYHKTLDLIAAIHQVLPIPMILF